MNVELSTLTIENQLGEGGYGVVHKVAGTPVAGDARPMVLKRPKPGLDPVHIPAVLEGMRLAVGFRDGLSASDRQEIDAISVWPVAMVIDRGREVGCLLPLIPPEFFLDIQPTNNIPGAREARGYGHLSRAEDKRKKLGYDHADYNDHALRLHVLAKLAAAIELLHRHGMVFGDLNPKNEVFTFSPARVLLLDCDAVAHVSDTTRAARQGHFPRWAPPEMQQNDKDTRPYLKKLQDFETDVYKLGLAFARFIHGAAGATQRMALPSPPPAVVTPQLATLVARALDPDPTARPNASELRQAAEDAVRTVAAPPVVTHASLDRRVALRGTDVTASWAIQAGSPYEVEISGPGGQRTKVQAGATTAPVRVANAGQVTLHVRTKYDSTTHVIGVVDCYELPPFQVQTGMLPAPQIPELTAFTAPSILREDIHVPMPAWPVLTEHLTDGFEALTGTAPTVEGLGVAVVNAMHASGIHTLGADLVGSFPVPDTLSLGPALIASLQEHFAAAAGVGALPNLQALTYTRVIQQLTERIADLEAGKP